MSESKKGITMCIYKCVWYGVFHFTCENVDFCKVIDILLNLLKGKKSLFVYLHKNYFTLL